MNYVFDSGFGKVCSVCGFEFVESRCNGRALLTSLRNFASVEEFLLSYEIVTPSVMTAEEMDLCSRCLSSVLTCDNVLSLFWRKVLALKSSPRERRDAALIPKVSSEPVPREGRGPGTCSSAELSKAAGGSILQLLLTRGANRVGEASEDSNGSLPYADGSPPNASERNVEDEIEETAAEPSSDLETDDCEDLFDAQIPASSQPKMKNLEEEAPCRRKPKETPFSCRSCEECSASCLTLPALYRHYQRQHSRPGGHSCRECGRSFASPSELTAHADEHARENFGMVSCIDCRRVFRASHLLSHFKIFHRERFSRTSIERAENGDTYWPCFHCGFFSGWSLMLELHILQEHPEGKGEPVFNCDECPKTFKLFDSLRNHKKLHRNQSHECPECRKTFITKKYLQRHTLTHTEEKFLVCTECGLKISKQRMKFHMASKHGIGEAKRFSCHVCPMRTACARTLQNHLARMHQIGTTRRKFKPTCEKCGKVLHHRDHYRAHFFKEHGIRLPGLKELPCTFCDTICFSKGLFASHMRKVHGQASVQNPQPLVCKLCSAACDERRQFLKHLREFHDLAVGGRIAYKDFLLQV